MAWLLVLLAACGTSGGGPPGSGVEDQPPSRLVSALLTVSDASALSGLEQWESPSGAGWPGGGPGAVPEGAEAPLGAMCLALGSILEGPEPSWQAYTVMFAQVDSDAGTEFVATLTEHLFEGDPVEVQAAFESLRDARSGCLRPEQTTSDDGVMTTASSQTYDAPPVGDERFAIVTRVLALAPDGEVKASFEQRLVVFRTGSVLAGVVSSSGPVESPVLTAGRFDQLVEAAASKVDAGDT